MRRNFTFLVIVALSLLGYTQQMFGQVLPFELSTETSPKWYYIENAGVDASYATGQVVKVNAMEADCSWGMKACTAAQLFRFEEIAGSTTTFRIINKAFPAGELLSSTKYGAAVNTAWSVELLTGINGDEYRIVSDATILHAQENGSALVSWDAGYNSASCWKFTPVGDAASLKADIDAAQKLFDTTVEGTAFTQYPATARTALSSAITTANSILGSIASYTSDQVADAQIALNGAITAYNNAMVGPYSTADNPVWFVIQVQVKSSDAARYRKVMASNAADPDKRIMGLNAAMVEPTDKIAWRLQVYNGYASLENKQDLASVCAIFVNNYATCAHALQHYDWKLTPVEGKPLVYKFVNEGPTLHMTNNPPYAFIDYDEGDLASQFKLIPVSEFYKSVLKFTIDSIAPLKDVAVVGTEKGQYPQDAFDAIVAAFAAAQGVYESTTATDAETLTARVTLLTAWNAFKQSVISAGSTGLNAPDSGIKVFAQDKKIVVTGTDAPVKAYTVSGIAVDATKPLAAGIYIVKVANITIRVVIL